MLLLAVAGCAEQPLPQQAIRRDDCLRNVRLKQLEQQISRCDEVVAAFPKDPGPRNDRYLLHSLAAQDAEACDDLREAVKLAEQQPAEDLDPQLRSDLKVRQQLCSQAASPAP